MNSCYQSSTRQDTINRNHLQNENQVKYQRRAANERERRRMHSINRGFDILRQLLPTPYYSKKLSKVDTLKQAIQYINELEFVLKSESNFASNAEKHQANSTAYPMIHQFMVDNATDKNSYVMSISWKRAFDTHSSATNAETFISSNLKTAKVWMPDEHTKN